MTAQIFVVLQNTAIYFFFLNLNFLALSWVLSENSGLARIIQYLKLPTLYLGAVRVHSKYADLISNICGFL